MDLYDVRPCQSHGDLCQLGWNLAGNTARIRTALGKNCKSSQLTRGGTKVPRVQTRHHTAPTKPSPHPEPPPIPAYSNTSRRINHPSNLHRRPPIHRSTSHAIESELISRQQSPTLPHPGTTYTHQPLALKRLDRYEYTHSWRIFHTPHTVMTSVPRVVCMQPY